MYHIHRMMLENEVYGLYNLSRIIAMGDSKEMGILLELFTNEFTLHMSQHGTQNYVTGRVGNDVLPFDHEQYSDNSYVEGIVITLGDRFVAWYPVDENGSGSFGSNVATLLNQEIGFLRYLLVQQKSKRR